MQVVKDTYSDSRGSGSSGGRPQRASAQGSLPRQDSRRDDVRGPSTGDPPSAQRARPSTYTPSSDTGARAAPEADQTDERRSGPPPHGNNLGSARHTSDTSGPRRSPLPPVPVEGQPAAGGEAVHHPGET